MKPIVHYTMIEGYAVQVGRPACVLPFNHPNHLPGHKVSNTKEVITSKVIRIGKGGEFETLNTIYRPVF